MPASSGPTSLNNSLAIIGTGMMGGSVGKAALENRLVDRVAGFDLRPDRLAAAIDVGAITEAAESLVGAVRDVQLVVIATPVETIASVFVQIENELREDALVTDLGSTKSRIVSDVGGSKSFIGGHPLAGKEEEGIEAASADLYKGCVWVLTPTSSTLPVSYERLARFVTELGASPLALDADRHDELIALTSHLPQIVASSLMGLVAREDLLPKLAAGGFRDTTRLAASSPDLWVGIVEQNREQVLRALDGFRSELGRWRDLIESRSWDALRSHLDESRTARSKIPSKPGRAALIGLAIPIPDKPGVLGLLTTALGEAGVNIEDMQIEHSTGGGRGNVHLLVEGEEAARAAQSALAGRGFHSHRAS